MPFLTTKDGSEIYYEIEGEGYPLIFTPGNQGYCAQYYLNVQILKREYRCIMHDTWGAGLSSKPIREVYETKVQAAYLHEVLTELGIERAVHVGHSWGGPITLQYYLDHPDEVAGIVLIGSYAAGSQLPVTEEQVLGMHDTLPGRREFFVGLPITHEKFPKYNPYGDELLGMIWKEGTKGPEYAAKAQVRGFFRLDYTDKISEVKVPTLIICGDDDKACPYETCSRPFEDGIADSRLVIVKDTGHFPHVEKPEICNEAIWKWLEEEIGV